MAPPWSGCSAQRSGQRAAAAGDGLLSGLDDDAEPVEGARELAMACARGLRERAWEGDPELADLLESALGTGATPMLRPLAIELDELSEILEGDPVYGGGAIELDTGAVWPRVAIEYAVEIGEMDDDATEDADHWLFVHCEGSRDAYHDMERFIEALDDPEFARKLDRAIGGRSAFRHFKDVLESRPTELDDWYGFSEERHLGHARAWLARAGYRPMPRRGVRST